MTLFPFFPLEHAGPPVHDGLARALELASVLAGPLAIAACHVEPYRLVVRETRLPIRNLPHRYDAATIVQLSDLHAGPEKVRRLILRVVDRVAALGPHMVVVTGDFVHNDSLEDVDFATYALQRLNPPWGIVAIMGNHDYYVAGRPGDWTPPDIRFGEQVASRLEKGGIELLRNAWRHLNPRDTSSPVVIGLDDLPSHQTDVVKAFRAVPPTVPTIVLGHSPDCVMQLCGRRTDVVLCGHTHGGQVFLPPFGALVSKVALRQYQKGLHAANGGYLYVNMGLGYTLPVRLGTRPEITVHILTA